MEKSILVGAVSMQMQDSTKMMEMQGNLGDLTVKYGCERFFFDVALKHNERSTCKTMWT